MLQAQAESPTPDALRRQEHSDDCRREQAEVDDERESQRRPEVLGEQAGEQRAEAEPAEVDDHGDEAREPAAVTRNEIDKGRGRGPGEQSGRQPGDNTAREDRRQRVGNDKEEGADRREDESGQQDGLAPDHVRELAESEQPRDHAECVDGEDHRHHQLPERVALREERIERGRKRRPEHRHEEGVGDQDEAERPAHRGGHSVEPNGVRPQSQRGFAPSHTPCGPPSGPREPRFRHLLAGRMGDGVPCDGCQEVVTLQREQV